MYCHLPITIDCIFKFVKQVWAGNPAKFLRNLTEEEMAFISLSASNYSNLAQVHAAENAKSFDETEFQKVLRKRYTPKDEEYNSAELVISDNTTR